MDLMMNIRLKPPDGQQIAFKSNRNGKFDIYIMNADGTDQRLPH